VGGKPRILALKQKAKEGKKGTADAHHQEGFTKSPAGFPAGRL